MGRTEGNPKHGMRYTAFYRKWHATGPRHGRVKRWDSFENFRDDMYESYVAFIAKHGFVPQLARYNSRHGHDTGKYGPNNCLWLSVSDNNYGRSNKTWVPGTPKTYKMYQRTGPHRSYVGQLNPNAKLTDAQVLEIVQIYETSGRSQQSIADEYGVSQHTVSMHVRKFRQNS